MKRYTVRVIRKILEEVEVDAENEKDAKRKAMYVEGMFVEDYIYDCEVIAEEEIEEETEDA